MKRARLLAIAAGALALTAQSVLAVPGWDVRDQRNMPVNPANNQFFIELAKSGTGTVVNTVAPNINYGGANPEYGGDVGFPQGGGDNFTIYGKGFIKIPTSGIYSFNGSHDDPVYVRIGTQTGPVSYMDTSCCGSNPFLMKLDAGVYPIEMAMAEFGGGEHVEIGAALGMVGNGGPGYALVGSNAHPAGLQVATTAAELGGLTAIGPQGARWKAVMIRTDGNGAGGSIDEARNAVNGLFGTRQRAAEYNTVIDYTDPSTTGFGTVPFLTNNPYPGDTPPAGGFNRSGGNDDNFATRITGNINFPQAGVYEFQLGWDDTYELIVGTNRFTGTCCGPTTVTVAVANPGSLPVILINGESGGDANIELAGRRIGSGSPFRLVGDVANTDMTLAAATGLGVVGGFTVKHSNSTVGVGNLATADAVLGGANVLNTTTVTGVQAINYHDNAGDGRFGDNLPFPGVGGGYNDNFVVQATGDLLVDEADFYTFMTNSDDGVRVRIDGLDVITDDALHGPEDRFGGLNLTAGLHTIELTFFELGGGAEVELAWARGNWIGQGFNGAFQLLEGIAPAAAVPEPATGLLALGCLGLLSLRRRRAA